MISALFEPCSVRYGEQVARGVKITCGLCFTVRRQHVATLRKTSGDDDAQYNRIAARKFERAGWIVGDTPAKHRCQTCAAIVRAQAAAPPPPQPEKEQPAMSPVQAPPTVPAPAPTPRAEAPREMSRADRRLIFVKLEEVYVDEKTGYSAGWTDKRVADDMGVPLAWVRAVRDENFGPQGNNPEIDALARDAKVWREEAASLRQAAAALGDKVKAMTARGEEIGRRLDAIQKAIGAR